MTRSSVHRALPAIGSLGLVLGLAALSTGALLAVIDHPAPVVGRVEGAGPQGQVAQFKVECGWSHAASDDPIVHPGVPGASHPHDFFGNTSTKADSTAVRLRSQDTTCQNKLDTAAYWAPALLVDDTPVTPIGSVAYYRPGPGVDPAVVRTYPAGLMMIAGDGSASEPQPLAIAAWHCGSSPVLHASPPACPDTAPLGVRVAFPDCWDGARLDSTDHQAHVAYSQDGRCPDGHPVPTPQLIFEVHYPVTGDPRAVSLASGGVLGVHADFLNAWDQEALEREVRVCLNGDNVCGVVSNRATG